MITLQNIDNIEEAEMLKGLNIYINREDYVFDGLLDEDYIGLDAYNGEEYKGKVVDVLKTTKNDLLVIDGLKKHMVPNIPEFVKKVDLENKKIYIEYIRGLDNED